MEDETKTEKAAPNNPAPKKAPSSPRGKAAETRLKEMSRRAKAKVKETESKQTRAINMIDLNWFYIGMGIAGIVGISYLVFRTPEKPNYKFTPAPRPAPVKQTQKPKLSPIPEKEKDDNVSKFELNTF